MRFSIIFVQTKANMISLDNVGSPFDIGILISPID